MITENQRIRIRDIAASRPGIGLAEMARDLNLPLSTAKYHILDAAIDGNIRLLRTRGRCYIYPIDDKKKAIEDQAGSLAN